MDDDRLRQLLSDYGEAVGKINEKTRPIYVKKLNHLRARRSMAEREELTARRPVKSNRGGGGATPRRRTVAGPARRESSSESDESDVNII